MYIVMGLVIFVLCMMFIFFGIPMLTLNAMNSVEREVFDGMTLEEWINTKNGVQ